MGIVIVFLLIGISSYLLYRSCSDFESGSRTIGSNLKDGVRGATINAIGSSLPEFFTSLFFLFILQDINGLTTGLSTVLGSAIFNILIIPGVVIIILVRKNHDVLINKKLILRDSGILLVAQFMLLIFLSRGRDITVLESFLLFSIYLVYIYILARGGIFHPNRSDGLVDKEIRSHAWKKIFLGVIKISLWCLLLVSACEILFSGEFPSFLSFLNFEGMFSNIMFVALLFAAIASSIPDLFLSAFDARTGDVDDSLSNPIASNLFDICIVYPNPTFVFVFTY